MKNETLHIRICPRCGASYGRTPALSSASRVPQSGQISVLPSALERAGVLP